MNLKPPTKPSFRTHWFCALWVVLSFPMLSQTTVINSGWQFSDDKTNWITVNIPHTWNDKDAFDDIPGYQRGIGFYKKQIYLSNEQSNNIHYLKFNAVNQEATVTINGKLVGNHKGGYTAFNYNITNFLKYDTYNLIEVTADNSHNINIPPLDADFTFYGGIYRDVELISVPKQHISLSDFASDGFYINYDSISLQEANMRVTVLLDNFEISQVSNVLKLSISDAYGNIIQTQTKKIKIAGNTTEKVEIQFSAIKNPNLWSPENPYLYYLYIDLLDEKGALLDEKSHNFGFRWVSVDPNQGFLLNGKPYKIIGVNRHQDFKGLGNAVPIELQKNDIYLMKEMGVNVLRFGHYPQARELYELCDRLGILVWSEIPIVNKVTNSPEFFQNCMTMQEEHLKQYYNYTSIAMFGYMNEIFLRLAFDNKSTQREKEDAKVYTYELAKQLEDFTRKTAPNRLTVMALHFNELYNDTKIADLPMFIGWNLYFGWYNGIISDFGEFLDDQHKRFPNRSIMISEYGPGADVNVSSINPKKYDYTQEYQLILHKSYYEQVMARDFVAGMTAWNFADFGSEFRGETIPHINQKGLVQYNREPKEVYYWYQSVLTEKPMVHIALNEKHPLNLIAMDLYPVSIFSNQKNGKVFLNGQSIATVQFENGLATVEVPFINGDNELKVITDSSDETKLLTVFKTNNLKTSNWKKIGINLGSHFNFYDEVSDVTFVADRDYSENLYGHMDGTPFNVNKDRNLGIPNNIVNTSLEGLYQMVLKDCNTYKVDIPDGNYKITLYFVEPQLKSEVEEIYNLNDSKKSIEQNDLQRIFDIILNGETIESQFNMSKTFPDKYGITISSMLKVKNNEGLTINLNPIEGKTVISGILIEKI